MRIHSLIDLCKKIIAPPFCVYCRIFMKTYSVLCNACRSLINPIVTQKISLTPKHQMMVHAVGQYKDPLKSLVLQKGYGNISAGSQIGELIWELTNIRHVSFDYIVPVPLHWTRFAYRGFNQSEEIARVIACKSGKQMINALVRKKMTKLQSGFDASGRMHNVKNAFVINQKYVKKIEDKNILIVDDLFTTGATLYSVARELLKLKPASILAVVLCRVK